MHYAASFRGHEKVVQALLCAEADVNAGGWYGNALQATSEGGHEKVVQILLDARADVNVQGGKYDNALQAALAGRHEKGGAATVQAGSESCIEPSRNARLREHCGLIASY